MRLRQLDFGNGAAENSNATDWLPMTQYDKIGIVLNNTKVKETCIVNKYK